MEAVSTAGVEFVGNLMRYAEVEQRDNSYKLLRLGNCEFEFDVSGVVYGGADADKLNTVREALGDFFQDTDSSAFKFVLPTSVLTSFASFSAVSAKEDAVRSQIGFETHLLNGGASDGDVFPGIKNDYSASEWKRMSVFHLPGDISDRLQELGNMFPAQRKEVIPSPIASTSALQLLDAVTQTSPTTTLLMGCYRERTDYGLVQANGERQVEARFTPTDSDRVYFGLESLHRHGCTASQIERVLVYGHNVTAQLLAMLEVDFGNQVSVFNPGPIVSLEEARFEKGFPLHAFVPCLGASSG